MNSYLEYLKFVFLYFGCEICICMYDLYLVLLIGIINKYIILGNKFVL